MKITFDDKVSTITSPLPEINRITADNINEIKEVVNYNADAGFPIGSGCDYFGSTAPENFMFADGSAISRTTYAALFAVIGTTYGSGDGSTTFNLPDKRERVSVMYKENSTMGTSGELFDTLGAKGGEDNHVLVTNELAKVTGTFEVNPQNTSNQNNYSVFTADNTVFKASTHDTTSTYVTTSVGNGRSNNKITMSFGNDEGHNNLQPYFVCNYIIRVK